MARENKKWFRAKRYGWGWTPQTFEGWIVTLIYVIFLIILSVIFKERITDPLFDKIVSIGIYGILLITLTIIFLVIAYTHGEKPHWRWGKKYSKK